MKLYPKSDHGLVYVILVSVPMVLAFAAILLYEWFGNDSILADTATFASKYVGLYTFVTVGWKIIRLRQLKKWDYGKTRLKIAGIAFAVNAAIIGCYLGERFFFG